MYDNGTSSASFASTFVQYRNGSGAFVAKNSAATLFSELVHSWQQFGQFASTFVH
jgi:DNA-binding FadR family transcriptional regulator